MTLSRAGTGGRIASVPGVAGQSPRGRVMRPDTACLSAGGATDMRGEDREVLVREDRLCIRDTLRPGRGVMQVAAGVPPEEGATVVRHAAPNGPRPLDTPTLEAVRPDAVGTGGRAHPGSPRMNPHARSVTRGHPVGPPCRGTALPVTPPHVIPHILVANSGMIAGDRGPLPLDRAYSLRSCLSRSRSSWSVGRMASGRSSPPGPRPPGRGGGPGKSRARMSRSRSQAIGLAT
jgi:hypothetical protein